MRWWGGEGAGKYFIDSRAFFSFRCRFNSFVCCEQPATAQGACSGCANFRCQSAPQSGVLRTHHKSIDPCLACFGDVAHEARSSYTQRHFRAKKWKSSQVLGGLPLHFV